ncbi:MAG: dihydrolipoyllysine-residue acetyltransferase [Pseudomonadota bacterium]
MSKQVNITIPDLGDFSDVEVIEILVAPGDALAAEDGIITLETDKATMDVPAPQAGRLVSISVAVGDTVNSGDVFAVLEEAGDDAADKPAETDDARFAETEVLDEGDTVIRKAVEAAGVTSVAVPDLGDFSDVEVIEVLVEPGESIELEQGLITLETDKATMDVPSTAAGTLIELLVAVGDRVNVGDALATVKASTADAVPAEAPRATPAEPAPAPPQPARPAEPATPPPAPAVVATTPTPTIDEAGFSRSHASPSVRRLARELGVDLGKVTGTGRKGRVSADDVKAWVKRSLAAPAAAPSGGALPATAKVDFAKFGPIREEKLSRIQKISGPRLQASWINLPHVTQHDLADITGLEDRRQALKGPAKEKGISLTPLAFIVRAVVQALAEFPTFAASLNDAGDALVHKDYRHIGFAADTPNGLVVPVIRDADRLDVYEIAKALGDLSRAAREGQLKLDQMQGAVFTISSLGGIGGTAFTPIVNAPEVAILGVSRSSMQPIWNGEGFEPRLMLPLSLSYDHRVIDGAAAVRFTTRLSELLGNVSGLLEAQP